MTRTSALLVVLVFLAASAGFADWRVLVLSGRQASITGQVARNQQSNTRALCSFRDDLQQRVTSTQDFLTKHPHGIPGIPAATLQVSLSNTRRTLRALTPLICPVPP